MSCNNNVNGIDECSRQDDDSSQCSNISNQYYTLSSCVLDNWSLVPDPILHHIFLHLSPRDILRAGQCCRRWNDISRDDFLWKKIFQRDFKVDRTIGLKPGEDILLQVSYYYFFFPALRLATLPTDDIDDGSPHIGPISLPFINYAKFLALLLYRRDVSPYLPYRIVLVFHVFDYAWHFNSVTYHS